MSSWFVYLVRCSDSSLYTWVTTDIDRRVKQHNWDIKGWAKYTRAKRPVELVYYTNTDSKSSACKEESRIKKLSKDKKEEIVSWRTNQKIN